MFVGCNANSKTRKRINVQCNAGLCWFSTHDTALTFPNIKTSVILCIQMWDWVKIHYFCCTTYYSHWSLLNKVYHKLENYFQCAYKIVAAILHQCKRKTCCILQISLKKIFFIFCGLCFKLMVFPFKREGINCHIFSFEERNSDRPAHKHPTYFRPNYSSTLK